MKVRPLTGVLGAEVWGLDLSRAEPDTVDRVIELVAEHSVVALRDQALDLDGLEALTDALGGFGHTPFLRPMEGTRGVVRVVREADEPGGFNFGGSWHSDWSFQPEPPSYTLLYAVDVPEQGGDTLYADMYRAYESLSEGLRATLDGLELVHSAGWAYAADGVLARTAAGRTMQIDTGDDALAEQVHPAVVVHPVTGRRALFANPTYTVRIAGWSAAESRPLLEHLYAHATQPGNTCRVRWEKRTLTIWDNRCTQHNAVFDYRGRRRELWRTTVAGAAPGGPSSMT